MKKLLKWIIGVGIILGLTACGSGKTPVEPDDATIKKDIQEYLVEMVDEKAEVSIFEKTDSEKKDDKLTVNCNVLYTIEDTNQQNKFALSYILNGNAWELSSCRIDSDEKGNTGDGKNTEETETIQTTEENNSSPKTEVKMSDEMYDFTFTLDGVVYQLPFAYTELTANGWTISSTGTSENDTVNANSFDSFYMAKNGNKINVYVINPSGNNKTVKDCKVGGIEIENYDLTEKSYFNIAKGITVESTYDDIIAAFGAANQTDEYDDRTVLTFVNGKHIYVRFYCYSENTKYNSIELRNFISDESDKTETSTEVPEYLSTYVTPTELGKDLTSPVIQIEGKLYSFPAPVSQFLEDGWQITSKPSSVGAGNYDSITLKKGDKKMDVTIMNFGDYQTIPENCAVYKVYFYSDSKINVVMSGNITYSSSKSDVENAITEDFSYSKGSSYQYSYYTDEINVSVSVDAKTEKVSYFSLNVEYWNYQ